MNQGLEFLEKQYFCGKKILWKNPVVDKLSSAQNSFLVPSL